MASQSLKLVDTSVFVDFFRGKSCPKLETWIQENRVVLSPFVKLELLQGVKKSEQAQLDLVLGGLIQLELNIFLLDFAEQSLKKIKSKGLTIGIVDLLLAAEAEIHGYTMVSHDKVFQRLADLKILSRFSSSS